jgi:hypothetical protein
MTLQRRPLRYLRPAVETILAGVLVGAVGTAFTSQMITSSAAGPASELPQARSYMLALIRNDLDAMSQLGPTADTVSQAINFQKRADALKDVKVGSLTYLGGAALGGAGVHVYVVEADDASGAHLVPFALTIYQGRVINVE